MLGNFITEGTSIRKLKSKVSKAFWRSILMAHLGDKMVLPYPITNSWAIIILSVILLSGIKAL